MTFKPLSYRIVKRKLENLGFSIVSQKGSHIKFIKNTNDGIITTIVPFHSEISAGTLKSILKQGFISQDDFDEA